MVIVTSKSWEAWALVVTSLDDDVSDRHLSMAGAPNSGRRCRIVARGRNGDRNLRQILLLV
jgi:hypothetical protein